MLIVIVDLYLTRKHLNISEKGVVPTCEHRATPDLWYYCRQLPIDIRELANRCYQFLCKDPKYPSLHFKKVGQLWSVRIGIHYRAIAVKEDDNFVWFWIGTHPEYDRLLSGG